MKFRVVLRDPFGTVSGEGEIEMAADSVFGGVAHAAGLTGGGRDTAMHTVVLPLTREQHEGQVRQITEGRYVQPGQMPWRIELAEA
jgi:hypothetical protein